MGWITIIMSILSALPQIIELIMKLIGIIQGIPDKTRRKQARAELKAAIAEAKRTKNSRPVEAVYEKYKNG